MKTIKVCINLCLNFFLRKNNIKLVHWVFLNLELLLNQIFIEIKHNMSQQKINTNLSTFSGQNISMYFAEYDSYL